jgi:hypothetical protein
MAKRLTTLICMLGAAALVSGCEDTRRALGIEKSVPDEFAVVSRAPLVMPPDFNLRPPAPGAERPQEGSPAEQARAALVGREVKVLELAGSGATPPDIRRIVDRETSAFAAEEKSFTDRLLFWREGGGDGTPLDPVAEKKRLDENAALGKKATDGPTPAITKGGRVLGVF